MLFQSVLYAGLCALSVVQATPIRKRATWPNPVPCKGACTGIHDPNIVYKDGTYYRFSTGGDLAIATTDSLDGTWEEKGTILSNGPKIKLPIDGQDTWAPDVSKVGDTYYAFYAVSKIGYQGSDIGVATSKTLDPGSWEDHGSIGLPKSSDYNLIDPNLFQDGNTLYLSFGSYWKDIFQTKLSEPTKYDGAPLSNIAQNASTPETVWEGAITYKNDNHYYLFFSAGACCNAANHLAAPGDVYRVQVCRADSITGPYMDQSGKACVGQNAGTLVLGSHDDVYAPGGQGVMKDPESGKTVMYYHYVKPSVGYDSGDFFFGYNYLDFSSGWPVVVE